MSETFWRKGVKAVKSWSAQKPRRRGPGSRRDQDPPTTSTREAGTFTNPPTEVSDDSRGSPLGGNPAFTLVLISNTEDMTKAFFASSIRVGPNHFTCGKHDNKAQSSIAYAIATVIKTALGERMPLNAEDVTALNDEITSLLTKGVNDKVFRFSAGKGTANKTTYSLASATNVLQRCKADDRYLYCRLPLSLIEHSRILGCDFPR